MVFIERISIFQLFALTIFFQIGTTVIFGFAAPAGRDAWIAILISTFLGIFIILLQIILMEKNSGLTLVEWFPAQLGKWLGIPIAWLYPLLFLYLAGRTLSDLKLLIPATILPGTPSWFVVIAILLVMVYCLFSGIEILARFTEYVVPILFLLFMIEIILLFSTGIVNFKYILPILGQGWGKVWTAVWPLSVTQTFAETLVLAMIWPLVTKPKKVKKTTILATIVSGVTIALFSIIEIAVLGEDTTEHTIYPLYLLVKQISVADFVENLDVIVALNMIITAYVKVTIYLFAAIRSFQLLMKVSCSRSLIFPVVLIVYLLAMTMSTNINEHIYVGIQNTRLTLWNPLLYIFLPGFLLIVTLIKKKRQSTETSNCNK